VHTKKRKMNIGEALVGIKRSGSQLYSQVRTIQEELQLTTYLRKQNIM